MSFHKFAIIGAVISEDLCKYAAEAGQPITGAGVKLPSISGMWQDIKSAVMPSTSRLDSQAQKLRSAPLSSSTPTQASAVKPVQAPVTAKTPATAAKRPAAASATAAKPAAPKQAPVWDAKMTEFVNQRKALEAGGARRGNANWDALQKNLNTYYSGLLKGKPPATGTAVATARPTQTAVKPQTPVNQSVSPAPKPVIGPKDPTGINTPLVMGKMHSAPMQEAQRTQGLQSLYGKNFPTGPAGGTDVGERFRSNFQQVAQQTGSKNPSLTAAIARSRARAANSSK